MAKCSNCGGKGFIIKENDMGEEEASPCKCWIQLNKDARLESKLIEANLNQKYTKYVFEDYLKQSFNQAIKIFNQPQVDILKNFIENPNEFMESIQTLWIWGKDPNAGHTTLATILGIALIKAGYKVRFFRMQSLLDIFYEFDKKSAFFENIKKFDVYIVDDAFVTDRSIVNGQYIKTHLFNFIDMSLGEDKHFIMTSDRLVNDISSEFEQIKVIMMRSLLELELRGSIIKTTSEHKTSLTSNIQLNKFGKE